MDWTDWRTVASVMFFYSVVACCITSIINNLIFRSKNAK